MQYKNFKTILTFSLLMLTWFASLGAASLIAKAKRKTIHLTQKDRAQIIESILRQELSRKEFVKIEKFYFVQNEVFYDELIPTIYKNKIELIESQEVRERAKNKEGILAFSFHEFKITRSKAIVEFGYTQNYEKSFNSKALIYEYRKVYGNWKGRATRGWNTVFEGYSQ